MRLDDFTRSPLSRGRGVVFEKRLVFFLFFYSSSPDSFSAGVFSRSCIYFRRARIVLIIIPSDTRVYVEQKRLWRAPSTLRSPAACVIRFMSTRRREICRDTSGVRLRARSDGRVASSESQNEQRGNENAANGRWSECDFVLIKPTTIRNRRIFCLLPGPEIMLYEIIVDIVNGPTGLPACTVFRPQSCTKRFCAVRKKY